MLIKLSFGIYNCLLVLVPFFEDSCSSDKLKILKWNAFSDCTNITQPYTKNLFVLYIMFFLPFRSQHKMTMTHHCLDDIIPLTLYWIWPRDCTRGCRFYADVNFFTETRLFLASYTIYTKWLNIVNVSVYQIIKTFDWMTGHNQSK